MQAGGQHNINSALVFISPFETALGASMIIEPWDGASIPAKHSLAVLHGMSSKRGLPGQCWEVVLLPAVDIGCRKDNVH